MFLLPFRDAGQLTRRLPTVGGAADGAVERHDEKEAVTLTLDGGHQAHAVRRGDWIVCEQVPSTLGLLAHLIEWGAEQGASIVAITDPAAARLPEHLGFVSR